jgi:hypothetical protein
MTLLDRVVRLEKCLLTLVSVQDDASWMPPETLEQFQQSLKDMAQDVVKYQEEQQSDSDSSPNG